MITYRRYGAVQANSLSVAPHCVKLFRRRWYVLVTMKKADSFAIYSLDRIEHIEPENTKFAIDPHFNAAAFFDECFGVVVGDGSKPTRVVLRAYGLEPHYLIDLPMHHSQRVLKVTEDYTDFELFLRPTADFVGHLMSRGSWLQVLKPASLALQIQQWHQNALDRYAKNEKNEEI